MVTCMLLNNLENVMFYFYLNRYFTDLATLYTQSDLNELKMDGYLAWVGLSRITSDGRNDWIWNNGHLFNFTDGNNMDYRRNCGAVSSDQK